MVRPLAPGGTATQEFPPRAAEWQRLRLPNVSVSTLSELYIENRKRGEFFLYIFVGITRLSSSLITMQDQERGRIARELHDSLGQELAAAKMTVEGILLRDHLNDSKSKLAIADVSVMIDRAIQQVRSISHLLHPPLLDEVGLLSAVRWFLEGLTKRSGIETFLDVPPPKFLSSHLNWKPQSSVSFKGKYDRPRYSHSQ
jgi:signal transduction histidine kinase